MQIYLYVVILTGFIPAQTYVIPAQTYVIPAQAGIWKFV